MLVVLAGHGELKSFVRSNQQLPDPRPITRARSAAKPSIHYMR
jgi:hypothetical protein